ncbi:MAG: hypothetical protein HW421_722 [Ignavibacteria bacterium]|nr:hypothetical protein [Ignavibacteria bacterium]
MDYFENQYDYNSLKNLSTGGSQGFIDENKIISYIFDKYQINVKVTSNNEFIGITEIKINKEFLSHKHKITTKGYHDVDEFYKE